MTASQRRNMRWLMIMLIYMSLITLDWLPKTQAQVDNAFFTIDSPGADTARAEYVGLRVDALGYQKNNEYFNGLVDGYTLFGQQLWPRLWYAPTANISLEAGLFARQDFGGDSLPELRPTLTLRYMRPHWQLVFGNLNGHMNHRLIEPLYNPERVINARQEQGTQMTWDYEDRLWGDVWVAWENMIYAGDSAKEEINAGASWRFTQLLENNLQLEVPFQLMWYHRGGQIDISSAPLVNRTYIAGGLGLAWVNPQVGSGLSRVHTDNYYVLYRDTSPQRSGPFRKGDGWYWNFAAQGRVKNKHHWQGMLSYWRGFGIYSPQHGGLLYQSAGTGKRSGQVVSGARELVYLRAMYTWQQSPAFGLHLRVEPAYDFLSDRIEFAHGFYVNYRGDFRLYKAPKPLD